MCQRLIPIYSCEHEVEYAFFCKGYPRDEVCDGEHKPITAGRCWKCTGFLDIVVKKIKRSSRYRKPGELISELPQWHPKWDLIHGLSHPVYHHPWNPQYETNERQFDEVNNNYTPSEGTQVSSISSPTDISTPANVSIVTSVPVPRRSSTVLTGGSIIRAVEDGFRSLQENLKEHSERLSSRLAGLAEDVGLSDDAEDMLKERLQNASRLAFQGIFMSTQRTEDKISSQCRGALGMVQD